jgi:hypothetical protein
MRGVALVFPSYSLLGANGKLTDWGKMYIALPQE